ncbi:MAG TPA: prepilin-type N-terminal cleavage/methylation domain-containing protein [Wenzhouxiangella sp.]
MQTMPASNRGLTLIETLVVLVIASVMATLVTLRLGVFEPTQSTQDYLSDVAQAVDAVCEQALFRARPQTLSFYAQGLIWNGVQDGALVTWPDETSAALTVEGHAASLRESPPTNSGDASVQSSGARPFHVLCDPLGQRSAFELRLQQASESATLVMAADGQWLIESGGGA